MPVAREQTSAISSCAHVRAEQLRLFRLLAGERLVGLSRASSSGNLPYCSSDICCRVAFRFASSICQLDLVDFLLDVPMASTCAFSRATLRRDPRIRLETRDLLLDRREALFDASSFSFLTASRSILSWIIRRSSLSDRLRLGVDLHLDARSRLVDQVDGLVGQVAVGDVAVREFRRRDDRRIGDLDAVVNFVALLQAAQDRDGRIRPTARRRVLSGSRRSSAASFSMYLRYSSKVVAPTQCSSPRASAGFQHVARVDRAFRLAGTYHRVQLVDRSCGRHRPRCP